MNVLVCHERFLFRFGADRVLMLLARHLKSLGHGVVLVGSQFDADSRALFGPQIVPITGGDAHLRLDEHTAEWLAGRWDRLCEAVGAPDLAIIGGWPFYSSLPLLREHCASLVIDFGAVPLEGYSGEQLVVQRKLRALRARHLPTASMIVAISRFIAETQSTPESGGAPVRTLLLGADHIDSGVWRGPDAPGTGAGRVAQLRADDRPVLLNLGRWEPGSYKNSEAAFDLVREVREEHPRVVLLVLGDPPEVGVPADLVDFVLPIGRPGDLELKEIMRGADLGVTLSRWEGFNLPLAEMQWLGRRVLALDAGAHREVIADPGLLCRSPSEMAARASELLATPSAERGLPPQALAAFRSQFGWDRVFREFRGLLRELVGVEKARSPLRIVMDVTSSTHDPANSGVIRVTRRLGRTLQEIAAPTFAVWEAAEQRYVLPTAEEALQLSQFNGPVHAASAPLSPPGRRIPLTEVLEQDRGAGGWVLISETVPGPRIGAALALARDCGMRLAAVFYDAIPVLYPELCPDPLTRDNHAGYMRELSRCDVVFPISAYSARCLRDFWRRAGVLGGDVVASLLPGEFGDGERALQVDAGEAGEARILCVSTLEPRKNQLGLARAFQRAAQQYPMLAWSLAFVGNRYAGAFDIADALQEISRADPRVRWLGVVDDAALAALYRTATFTVYPSLVEGFGLPIVESLWHGRPCLCSGDGVMGELAAGGGCLTTDVRDEEALAGALARLALDPELRRRLAAEAVARPVRTWDAYAVDLCARLALETQDGSAARVRLELSPWPEALGPDDPVPGWLEHGAERLALTGLLLGRRPRCSIAIGTSGPDGLALVQEYSQVVFAIEVTPAGWTPAPGLTNVSVLAGPRAVVLPILLRELETAGIPLGFVLIEGDRGREALTRDLECVLEYTPREPLFVALHGRFAPEHRRALREVPWERSPYLRWVDVDFVPGLIVDPGGGAGPETRCGLALAYFAPGRRRGEPRLGASGPATADGRWARSQGGDP